MTLSSITALLNITSDHTIFRPLAMLPFCRNQEINDYTKLLQIIFTVHYASSNQSIKKKSHKLPETYALTQITQIQLTLVSYSHEKQTVRVLPYTTQNRPLSFYQIPLYLNRSILNFLPRGRLNCAITRFLPSPMLYQLASQAYDHYHRDNFQFVIFATPTPANFIPHQKNRAELNSIQKQGALD